MNAPEIIVKNEDKLIEKAMVELRRLDHEMKSSLDQQYPYTSE